MNFFEELREFGKGMFVWLIFWLIFSAFFFFFGVQKTAILGKEIFIPWLNQNSLAVSFFALIKSQALPENIQLVVLTPLSAFLGQAMIAFFLGFLVSLPIGFYRVLNFVLPAFKPAEKRATLEIFLPSIILFFAGSAFAYFFIMPATFKILYSFASQMGVVSYFELTNFIFLFLAIEFMAGLMFLLPAFMVLLVRLGIVGPSFWSRQWHYASLFFLIVSAVVTPDGTGITMMLLLLPLTFLYLLGYTVSKLIKKSS